MNQGQIELYYPPYSPSQIGDDDTVTPQWNTIDGQINRTSFHGNYDISNRMPVNVCGRTGIIGRGLLGRYGPNHAGDPIVTKWKRTVNGSIVQHSDSNK